MTLVFTGREHESAGLSGRATQAANVGRYSVAILSVTMLALVTHSPESDNIGRQCRECVSISDNIGPCGNEKWCKDVPLSKNFLPTPTSTQIPKFCITKSVFRSK